MPTDRPPTFSAGFGYLCTPSAARAVTLLLSPPLPAFEFTHKFRSLLQILGSRWLNTHACDQSRLSMKRNKPAASHWPQVQPLSALELIQLLEYTVTSYWISPVFERHSKSNGSRWDHCTPKAALPFLLWTLIIAIDLRVIVTVSENKREAFPIHLAVMTKGSRVFCSV